MQLFHPSQVLTSVTSGESWKLVGSLSLSFSGISSWLQNIIISKSFQFVQTGPRLQPICSTINYQLDRRRWHLHSGQVLQATGICCWHDSHSFLKGFPETRGIFSTWYDKSSSIRWDLKTASIWSSLLPQQWLSGNARLLASKLGLELLFFKSAFVVSFFVS